MSSRPSPIPLRPDWSTRRPPRDAFVRALAAVVRHQVNRRSGDSPEDVLRGMFERDEDSLLLLRAAVSPASMTTASQLVATSIADFVSNIGPQSAASQLFRSGMQVSLNGPTTVTVPTITGAAAGASFVEEGQPIPVRQSVVGAISLAPRKLGVINIFTHEMAASSAIEQITRDVVTQNIGAQLDSVVLGTGAASAAAPAGLRSGVSGLTPTTGGTTDSMRRDVGQLVAAVAAVANGQIALIGSPDVSAKLLLQSNPALPFPVLSSGGLAAGTLVAIATNAVAVAVDPQPRVEASTENVVHMEDSPTALSAVASPNTVAAPIRSAWQTDVIGLRVILRVSWGLRASGAVSWLTGITW